MNWRKKTTNLLSESDNSHRTPLLLLLVGLIIFGIMAAMALVLYKERMLHYDTAWISFLLIQEGEFTPVLGRYGMALGQLLPMVLLKSGADIEAILKSYSLFLVLLYVIYLLIMGAGFKNKKGIIALCIAMTLTFRETFFYTTAELFQGTALSVLLWVIFSHSLNQTGWKRNIGLLSSVLLIFCISFFHPIGLFTVFFVLSIEYIHRQNWKDYRAIAVIFFAIAWYLIRIKLFVTSSYELQRMITIRDLIEYFDQIFHLPSTSYFIAYFKNHYIFPFLVGVLGLVALLFRKKWLLASYIAIYVLTFWVIIMIGKREEGSPIMLQNYYTVFGLFGGVLLALALEKRSAFIQAGVVLVIGLFSLKSIYQSRYNYQLRTDFLEHINEYGQQFSEKKYVLDMHHIPFSYSYMNWALPVGTMMYSQIHPHQEPVTFFATYLPDTLTANDVQRPESFLGAEFAPHWFSVHSLNEKYFSAATGAYRIMNTCQTAEMMQDSVLNLPMLKIHAIDEVINKKGGWTSMEINLKNDTKTLFGSIPDEDIGLYIYYRFFDQNGALLRSDIKKLLMDLSPGTHYTDIIVYDHPAEPNSRMEIGFFVEQENRHFPKAQVSLNTQE